ncbi:MAG: serine/threonine-protein kinase [Micromonosporaceae bacterium]
MSRASAVTSGGSVLLAGRYRLDRAIAAGGVGEVWRAVDVVLDRPVAVKLLRAEYAQHPETVARFRAEARHAGSLTHPGVAQVYDYGEADPPHPPYLVMELVDGPSLAGVLASGPLDPGRTMDVVAQAAAGLQAAHAAGLVHRDIKPGNLLLGRSGAVKITDFGIAHAAGSAPITRMGTLVGTPGYLAPERAAGAPATPAADVYSLGVVAHECLAGVPPFSGEPLEVAAAHRHRPLPPLPSAVPPAVAALVAALTAKDPAERPGTAAEVAAWAAQLRDVMAGAATLSLGVGPHGWQASGANAQPVTLAGLPVEDPPPGHRRWWWGRAGPRRGGALAVAGAVVAAGLAGWLLAGVFSAAPPRQAAGVRQSAPAASAPAVQMVAVSGALAGQPVSAVWQQLLQLGVRPHVVWVRSRQQAPGTVVSVQPSGRVPVGSTVTVTVARQFRGHGHGGGQGGNNGGD